MSDSIPIDRRARTKIVATVGPVSKSEAALATLVEAGVDVFRLNMAHGQMDEHAEVLRAVRRLSDRVAKPIAVLVDLAGPKIRLGELPSGQIDCAEGAELSFVRGEASSAPGELVATYDKLVDELAVGDRVMLADGTVSLEVMETRKDRACCRVKQSGRIRSRQGINLPGVKVSLPAMSEADFRHALWAAEMGADYVSLSFVRAAAEVLELKSLLRANRSTARVVAKIEKQEALDHLEAIVAAADAVMVARGDLGVEIDVARMPVVQKQIVATCNRHQKPVIIATQMLDSMQRSRYPTRAEVTDVANAILDGCDACMLSGETAVGDYPREAVEMMNRVAVATEALFRSRSSVPEPGVRPEGLQPITQAVVYGAGHIAQQLDAKLVVVVSHSGVTALTLSKQRGYAPILGVSDSEATRRQMCLYWGVIPLAGVPTTDSHRLFEYIEKWGAENGVLRSGDHIVLVAGLGLASQGHNMVRIHRVDGLGR